jgi:hypothetical protein
VTRWRYGKNHCSAVEGGAQNHDNRKRNEETRRFGEDRTREDRIEETRNCDGEKQNRRAREEGASRVMKPTIGRIVLVRASDRTWPGVVQTVNDDGSVDAGVFRGKHFVQLEKLKEGTDINQWSWPPREAQPAAATDARVDDILRAAAQSPAAPQAQQAP